MYILRCNHFKRSPLNRCERCRWDGGYERSIMMRCMRIEREDAARCIGFMLSIEAARTGTRPVRATATACACRVVVGMRVTEEMWS